ncbi:MAG: hypothetical protein EKK46_06335 [Rhodocyclaceae bacterium]|nr:MAG: hypothetical protein EKK46_06335 [Rhodocyclaceae bacterium]
MLLKPDPFNPNARACWECRHGNDGKPTKKKIIVCSVDGDVTMRLIPGICPSFSENERGAKRQKKRPKEIVMNSNQIEGIGHV